MLSFGSRFTAPLLFGVAGVVWLLGLLALASSCRPSPPEPFVPPPGGVEPNAVVVHTIDGDTISVQLGEATETVRLLGVDTPETVDPNRPEQCFGAEASTFVADLLPKGTPIRVERDQQAHDDYGRLLAYVFRADDALFVNLELLRHGYADVLVIEPNTAYAGQFGVAVASARNQGVGLWGACDGPDQPLSDHEKPE